MHFSAKKLKFINQIQQDQRIRDNTEKVVKTAENHRPSIIRCVQYDSKPTPGRNFWIKVKEINDVRVKIHLHSFIHTFNFILEVTESISTVETSATTNMLITEAKNHTPASFDYMGHYNFSQKVFFPLVTDENFREFDKILTKEEYSQVLEECLAYIETYQLIPEGRKAAVRR
jgi:hypothetical protein